jgi:hypothetical protein
MNTIVADKIFGLKYVILKKVYYEGLINKEVS